MQRWSSPGGIALNGDAVNARKREPPSAPPPTLEACRTMPNHHRDVAADRRTRRDARRWPRTPSRRTERRVGICCAVLQPAERVPRQLMGRQQDPVGRRADRSRRCPHSRASTRRFGRNALRNGGDPEHSAPPARRARSTRLRWLARLPERDTRPAPWLLRLPDRYCVHIDDRRPGCGVVPNTSFACPSMSAFCAPAAGRISGCPTTAISRAGITTANNTSTTSNPRPYRRTRPTTRPGNARSCRLAPFKVRAQ